MIRNEITMLDLESIHVARDSRQRRELRPAKVEDIAADIAKRSLIHAIVVEENTDKLIAGEHRLEAFRRNQKLGIDCPDPDYQNWTQIPVRYAYDVSVEEIEAIELMENLSRVGMDWKDEALAVLRIHQLKQRLDSEWCGNDTAAFLGMSSANISRYIHVGKAVADDHPKMIQCSSISSAYNVLKREMDRAIASELEDLESMSMTGGAAGPSSTSAPASASDAVSASEPDFDFDPSVSPADGTSAAPEPEIRAAELDILTDSFLDFAPAYDGPKFNFLHCDFPYGIGLDKSAGQNSAKDWNEYDDSPEIYWDLLQCLADNQNRILAHSSHIMFWLSFNMYEETRAFFSRNMPEWTVQAWPMIWHRTDNSGLLPDPNRYGRRTYEIALCLSRGDRQLVKAKALSYGCPWKKTIHRSEKPETMLRHFFEMFVDGFTRMLDPTCGSATSLRAAEYLGARSVCGLEIDTKVATDARAALQKSRNLAALA